MQPVQDLTVEDRVSRTQFQYTLEDPDANELNRWTQRFVEKLKQLPELRDVATDQQTSGLAASLVIDRQTASRLGISPQMIDQTLYDAFGQRQVSTLYTQLNQYHVVLETMPDFQKDPAKLQDIYVRSAATSQPGSGSSASSGSSAAPSNSSSGVNSNGVVTVGSSNSSSNTSGPTGTNSNANTGSSNPVAVTALNGAAVPLSAFTHFESRTAPLSVNHQGQFPVVTISFNLAPRRLVGRSHEGDRADTEGNQNAAEYPGGFSGHGRVVPGLVGKRAASDSGCLDHRIYRAGRSLRELRSSDHDFVHASLRRSRCDSRADDHRDKS